MSGKTRWCKVPGAHSQKAGRGKGSDKQNQKVAYSPVFLGVSMQRCMHLIGRRESGRTLTRNVM